MNLLRVVVNLLHFSFLLRIISDPRVYEPAPGVRQIDTLRREARDKEAEEIHMGLHFTARQEKPIT